MYLYFDNKGTLLETINDEALRQYNKGVNTVNVFIEDAENSDSGNIPANISTLEYWFKLADGEVIQQNYAVSRDKDLQKKTIPFDRNRDLRHFQYGKVYEFFVIEVPCGRISEYSNSDPNTVNFVTEGDVFKRGGLVLMTIQAKVGSDQWLSLEKVAFMVEDAVLLPNEAVNSAEFNWLLQHYVFGDSGEGTTDYDGLANKPIINQDLTADGFTPKAGAYYRHTGTGGGGTPAPVNPIAVGDTISTLYFDTTKTPDFSSLDWENADDTADEDVRKIGLIELSPAMGESYSEKRVTANYNTRTKEYFLALWGLIPLWSSPSGWNANIGNSYDLTSMGVESFEVIEVKHQDIWGAYISKDGQWTSGGSAYTTGAIYYYNGSEYKMLGDSDGKGEQGDTGEIALEYGNTYTEQYEGDIADEPISLAISDFNRTPVVGDKFLLVFKVTESGNAYIAPFTITEVGTTTTKASISASASTKISGDDGTQGANGKPALVSNVLWGNLVVGLANSTIGSFNRTPIAGEKVVIFSSLNQYALATIESVSGDTVSVRISSPIISTKGATGETGATGATGATGLTALEYKGTYTEQYEGDISDEEIELIKSNFNRAPVIGDTFLLVFNVTESGNIYVAPFTITGVGTTTVKASLDGVSPMLISGEAGTKLNKYSFSIPNTCTKAIVERVFRVVTEAKGEYCIYYDGDGPAKRQPLNIVLSAKSTDSTTAELTLERTRYDSVLGVPDYYFFNWKFNNGDSVAATAKWFKGEVNAAETLSWANQIYSALPNFVCEYYNDTELT